MWYHLASSLLLTYSGSSRSFDLLYMILLYIHDSKYEVVDDVDITQLEIPKLDLPTGCLPPSPFFFFREWYDTSFFSGETYIGTSL